jgi:hypothetical protein
METIFQLGLELFCAGGVVSYGLCVDCVCPGSACDPLTCTFCCCGMVPTVRGAERERLARLGAAGALARAARDAPSRP